MDNLQLERMTSSLSKYKVIQRSSRSVHYKEFINYDHYAIDQKNTKGNKNNDLVPHHISGKKDKLLLIGSIIMM